MLTGEEAAPKTPWFIPPPEPLPMQVALKGVAGTVEPNGEETVGACDVAIWPRPCESPPMEKPPKWRAGADAS